MKRMLLVIKNKQGLSLIELMVAALIFSFVIGFGLRFFLLQKQWAVYQEDAVEAQQQARVAMDLMVRELSLLGAGVPEGESRLIKATQQEVEFIANLYTAVARLTQSGTAGQQKLSVEYIDHSEKFDKGKTVSICMLDRCEWNTLASNGGKKTLKLNRGLNEDFPFGSTIQVINDVRYALKPENETQFKLVRRVDGGTSPVAEGLASMDFTYLDREGGPATTLTNIRRVQIRLTIPLPRKPEHVRILESEIWLRNG
jgi:prepilin-type N-terminal cleavage/methylation domain-containing protein